MTVWLYKGGQRYPLLDPIGYIGAARTPVNELFIYTGGQRHLVWSRSAAGLTVTSSAWDRAVATWTAPGAGADSYRLKRGGTLVYSGTLLTYTDIGLVGGTAYSYSLEVIRSGAVVSTVTKSITTPARAVPVLTTGSDRWDRVQLSWTDADQGSVDNYVVKRGGTQVYSGATKSFTDTALMPGTTYSYTLESYRAGVLVNPTASGSRTTGAYPSLGFSAGAASYSQINLSWAAANGSVDEFLVYRGGSLIYQGLGTSKADTGLAEQTGYSYTLYARRAGTNIASATASATTSARPVSTGYARTGYARTTSGGWTGSTVRNPGGGNISIGVGGTMTSIVIAVWGYQGLGRMEPWVGGVARQQSVIGAVNVGGLNTLGLENIGFAPGTFAVGMKVGGSGWGQSEWDTWSPYSNWQTQVFVDGINYWYYASKAAVDEMRAQPWWRDELAEAVETRSLHIETTNDVDGRFLTATITDKDSGQVLIDWERGTE